MKTVLIARSASPRAISPPIREMPEAKRPRRLRRTDGGARLRFALGLGSHPARGRAELSRSSNSLTALTAIAARTSRIKLGTGVLVLPLRNPVILAKQLASMDQLSDGRLLMGMASGWYKREFDAVGVPFERRGKIMDENLEILQAPVERGARSTASTWPYNFRKAVMYPKPVQQPQIADPDRRLCRPRAQARRRRRATGGSPISTRPRDFTKSWTKIRTFAEEAGKDPDDASERRAAADHGRPVARRRSQDDMMDWLNKEWDFPSNSDCSRESAIMGTVDECVEQLKAHLAVGVQKIIFVPYKYEMGQVEIIAREIMPRLKAWRTTMSAAA